MSGDKIVEQLLKYLDEEITSRIISGGEYDMEVVNTLERVHDWIIELKTL